MDDRMDRKLDKSAKKLAWEPGVGRIHCAPTIVEVVRWTPTQAVCKSGNQEVRFRIEDGCEVGGRYGSRAVPITPAIMNEIRRERYDGAIRSACHAIEETARKLAHLDKRQADPAALGTVLKGLAEQKALLDDWLQTLSKDQG